MRMWMVDPKIMCRKHLLGEHVELHMFVGTINKGISLEGYFNNDLLEMEALHSRHFELVTEMEARGYSHKSPLPPITYTWTWETITHEINKKAALKNLLDRCPECRARYYKFNLKEYSVELTPA